MLRRARTLQPPNPNPNPDPNPNLNPNPNPNPHQVADAEMARRKAAWVAPPYKYTRGTMYRYIKTVSSAQKGCVTDE